MKTRRSTNILAAVALLGLALTMVIGKLRQHGQDDDHEKLTAESSESSRSSGDHGRTGASAHKRDKPRVEEEPQKAIRKLPLNIRQDFMVKIIRSAEPPKQKAQKKLTFKGTLSDNTHPAMLAELSPNEQKPETAYDPSMVAGTLQTIPAAHRR